MWQKILSERRPSNTRSNSYGIKTLCLQHLWKNFQAHNKNELVSIYGNFINRVVVLTNKYWNGVVPNCNKTTDYDKTIIAALNAAPKKIGNAIEKFHFKNALSVVVFFSKNRLILRLN